jgi:ABC-type nickel/cobalt efflux system permease component RcnA
LRAAGVAFVLGMVHALTPGHGKAILFSYFLGRRVRPWDGMVTAAQVAGLHIGTAATLVVAVGGAAYVLGRPAGVALALQGASALAVTVVGVWYLWRAVRGASALEPTHHHSGVATAVGLLPCPLTMLVLSAAFERSLIAVVVDYELGAAPDVDVRDRSTFRRSRRRYTRRR